MRTTAFFLTFLVLVALVAAETSRVATSRKLGEKKDLAIIGGTVAATNQFPFQVYLSVNKPEGSFSCGAFLITPHHVGTAAHCVDGVVNFATVQAGSNFNDLASGQVANASFVSVHPLWNPTTITYDSAVLYFLHPFTIDGTTTRLGKLATSSPSNGDKVWLSGWGLTANGGDTSDVLLFVDLPFVGFSECQKIWDFPDSDEGVINCAGGEVGKGSCQGDSGGALFKTDDIANPVDVEVIGITSFVNANDCGSAVPGGYTDIAGFAGAWFEAEIKKAVPFCHQACQAEFRACPNRRKNRQCRRDKKACILGCGGYLNPAL